MTEGARKRALDFLAEEGQDLSVRISVLDSSPLAPRFELSIIERWEQDPDDRVVELDGVELVIPADSAGLLQGASIDWVESEAGSGFHVESPQIVPIGSAAPTGPVVGRIRQVLEHQINPAIASHGGSISLVDVREDVAYVRMQGGCQGCGMAGMTLTQGVRRMLLESVPELTDVQDVTDHASGANPYYAGH
ncbi:MAG: NifU family protein [Gemmatimonadota bacterium]